MKNRTGKLLAVLLALAMVAALAPATALADEVPTEVKSAEDLAKILANSSTVDDGVAAVSENTVTLKQSVEIENYISMTEGEITLDLGTYDLTRTGEGATVFSVTGGTLTIQGSGTISCEATEGTLLLVQAGAKLIMNGGTVSMDSVETGKPAVGASGAGAEFTLNDGEITGNNALLVADSGGKVILNGGRITQNSTDTEPGMSAVYSQKGSTVEVHEGAVIEAQAGIMVSDVGSNTLTMDGGTITAREGAIYTNGSSNSSGDYSDTQTITITGGAVESTEGTAIYLPGKGGKTTISGEATSISGAVTGIELRAGELTVEGGNISGGMGEAATGETPDVGGSVTWNAGIGVAPYEGQSVKVTIEGGSISGGSAFYQNEEEGNETDTGNYTFSITGGEFEGEYKDVDVSKEGLGQFISGGTFKSGNVPMPFLTEGKVVNKDGEVVDCEDALEIGLAAANDTSEDPLIVEEMIPGADLVMTVDTDGDTNIYNVQITADGVRYHKNGEGKNGYWIGFYVKAPEGAESASGTFAGEDFSLDELEILDDEGSRGVAFYYDLASNITEDTVEITFKGESGDPLGAGIINVDLTGAQKDDMTLVTADFIYNWGDDGEGNLLSGFSILFNNNMMRGKYLVTVIGPEGDIDYCETWRDLEEEIEYRRSSWACYSDEVHPGTYTFQTYTYTGRNIGDLLVELEESGSEDDPVTIDPESGVPSVEGHEFAPIGDTLTVNVVDAITGVEVTNVEVKSESESKAVASAEASVSDRTITITGGATALGDEETVQVTLFLTNPIGNPAMELVVTIAKDEEGTYKVTKVGIKSGETVVGENDGDTFKLLVNGKDFKVEAVDFTVKPIEVAAGETPTPEVSDELKGKLGNDEGVKKIAEATKPAEDDTTLQELATAEVTKPDAVDPDASDAASALTDKGIKGSSGGDVTVEEVNFFVQPHLTLDITRYIDDSSNKTLSVDISAVYDLVATTAETADDIILLEESGGGANDPNAVRIGTQPLTVSKPIQLTVGLPGGFVAVDSDPVNIYVKHTKNGGEHYHEAEVRNDDGSLTASFTSTDGLSPFTFESDAHIVAEVGWGGEEPTYFDTLQAAFDAVQDGGNITVTSDCSEVVVTVSREVTFTVYTYGDGQIGTIKAGSGYTITMDFDKDTNSYTVKAKPSSRPSAPGQAEDDPFQCDGGDDCPSHSYTDVTADYWAHPYIDYVKTHGVMDGISSTQFAPESTVNRATMATALWKLADKPVVTGEIAFVDVDEDTWYADAIRWAAKLGIINGYDDTHFGPDDAITREQMALMLYRYEKNVMEGGFTGDWSYELTFSDRAGINDYAVEAVSWLNMNKVMEGIDGAFSPAGKARRCELAKILTVYLTLDE